MYGKLALCFIGLSSGGVIAAGIFAFLAIIGAVSYTHLTAGGSDHGR